MFIEVGRRGPPCSVPSSLKALDVQGPVSWDAALGRSVFCCESSQVTNATSAGHNLSKPIRSFVHSHQCRRQIHQFSLTQVVGQIHHVPSPCRHLAESPCRPLSPSFPAAQECTPHLSLSFVKTLKCFVTTSEGVVDQGAD